MKSSMKELNEFLDRKGAEFVDTMYAAARAYWTGKGPMIAERKLQQQIGNTLALADLNGRVRIRMEAQHLTRANFAETNPLGALPFQEAVEEIRSRQPAVVQGWEQAAHFYTENRGFTLARASSQKIVDRVQEQIVKFLEEGMSPSDVEQRIKEIGDHADMGEVRKWTRHYAATVYRTNASTAYNGGRFTQAQDPDVKEVIPAMEFFAQLDEATRKHHRAAHGFIAASDDPAWARYRPPLGFQCRCGADFVSIFELEEKGLILNGNVTQFRPPGFENARPDKGFRPGVIAA